MAGRKRMLLVLLTLALCILADQATKFAVKSALSKTKPRIVAAGLLKLDYSLNKGGVLAFE